MPPRSPVGAAVFSKLDVADFLYQRVEVHVVVGGLRDRGDHLRQHLSTAVNSVPCGAVDKWANADTSVHFRTGNFRIGTLSCFGAHEASRSKLPVRNRLRWLTPVKDCLERVRICASLIEVYAFRYGLSVSKLNSIS